MVDFTESVILKGLNINTIFKKASGISTIGFLKDSHQGKTNVFLHNPNIISQTPKSINLKIEHVEQVKKPNDSFREFYTSGIYYISICENNCAVSDPFKFELVELTRVNNFEFNKTCSKCNQIINTVYAFFSLLKGYTIKCKNKLNNSRFEYKLTNRTPFVIGVFKLNDLEFTFSAIDSEINASIRIEEQDPIEEHKEGELDGNNTGINIFRDDENSDQNPRPTRRRRGRINPSLSDDEEIVYPSTPELVYPSTPERVQIPQHPTHDEYGRPISGNITGFFPSSRISRVDLPRYNQSLITQYTPTNLNSFPRNITNSPSLFNRQDTQTNLNSLPSNIANSPSLFNRQETNRRSGSQQPSSQEERTRFIRIQDTNFQNN